MDPIQTKAWLPDTQRFLAFAIVSMMMVIILVLLLKDYANLNEKVYGALLTLLGVIAACFKDTFSFFFGSSKGSEKKDDALISGSLSPTPVPPAPGTTTTTTTSASTDVPAPAAPAPAPAAAAPAAI